MGDAPLNWGCFALSNPLNSLCPAASNSPHLKTHSARLQNHTSIVWLSWAGTSGDRLVQPTCSQQGQLEQVVQDCVQLGFERLHRWRHHNLSEQRVPVFDRLHWKSVFNQNVLCLSLCPLLFVLSVGSVTPSLQIHVHMGEISSEPSLLRAEQSQCSQPLLICCNRQKCV